MVIKLNIIDKLEIGDVISLDSSSGSNRFHTVAISDKTNENIYLASNTSDYAKEPWYPENGKTGKKADFEGEGYHLVFIKVK